MEKISSLSIEINITACIHNDLHNSFHYVCALQLIYLSSCHLQLREYCAVPPMDAQLCPRNYQTTKLLSMEALKQDYDQNQAAFFQELCS